MHHVKQMCVKEHVILSRNKDVILNCMGTVVMQDLENVCTV